jgi:peptidoglycan/LPS O-acetylase OafA/YrhL
MLTLALLSFFWLLEFGPFQGRSKIVIEHLLPSLILGVVVMSPLTLIGRCLEIRPIRYLGKLSYSLYIWQQMFLGGQGNHLPWWAGIICAGLAAYISYELIERPCIGFGRRVVDRLNEKNRLAAAMETT